MKFTATMKGGNELSANLKAKAAQFPNDVAKAMYQETNVEVVEMKRRCPVDVSPHAPHPGNLRNSIHAELPVIKGKQISIIVATGEQAPYGIYVHENPDAHHTIGEWKFMEGPLKESAPYMAERIAVRIDLNKAK